MTEVQGSYFVTYKEPIEGVVTKRKCGHCGHYTEVGVETKEGQFIPLNGGEKIKIFGRETLGYGYVEQPAWEIRMPGCPLSEAGKASFKEDPEDTLN
ncbi:MAG: hypothetical protein ISR62_03805 [Desulfobacteraceae bacterium]|nr:hypothetical protein [Desulfobacterales bacterium]MBL6967528.1 hypothetical protein [Desulfobacteraceae bacterium]